MKDTQLAEQDSVVSKQDTKNERKKQSLGSGAVARTEKENSVAKKSKAEKKERKEEKKRRKAEKANDDGRKKPKELKNKVLHERAEEAPNRVGQAAGMDQGQRTQSSRDL